MLGMVALLRANDYGKSRRHWMRSRPLVLGQDSGVTMEWGKWHGHDKGWSFGSDLDNLEDALMTLRISEYEMS